MQLGKRRCEYRGTVFWGFGTWQYPDVAAGLKGRAVFEPGDDGRGVGLSFTHQRCGTVQSHSHLLRGSLWPRASDGGSNCEIHIHTLACKVSIVQMVKF